MAKGDVTLRCGDIVVVITAEDRQGDIGLVDFYLSDGYEIIKDEREEEEEG